MANIGHAQMRKDNAIEPALVTVGDDLNSVRQFLPAGRDTYSAADVIASLLRLVPETPGEVRDEVAQAGEELRLT